MSELRTDSEQYRELQARAAANRELLMRDASGSDPRERARLRVAERAISQLMKDAVDGHVAVRFSRAKNTGITATLVSMYAEMLRLHERVVELEARPPELKYGGVWQRNSGHLWPANTVVTHDGSAWVARGDTGEEPGKSASWQLMVKRGKDAR